MAVLFRPALLHRVADHLCAFAPRAKADEIAPLAARHKDDNAIMNGRKLRHHRPLQVEVLYYPQDTDDSMGPTCVLPYSREPSIHMPRFVSRS